MITCHVRPAAFSVLSCLVATVQLFVTPWTVAHQTLSMEIFQARILGWVAVPSSRGSSQSRDQTQVSHIAGGFFTICITREVLCFPASLYCDLRRKQPSWTSGRQSRSLSSSQEACRSEVREPVGEAWSSPVAIMVRRRAEAALGAEAMWQEEARRGFEKTYPRITMSWGGLGTRPKIFKSPIDTPPTWRNSEFILSLFLLLHYSCSK